MKNRMYLLYDERAPIIGTDNAIVIYTIGRCTRENALRKMWSFGVPGSLYSYKYKNGRLTDEQHETNFDPPGLIGNFNSIETTAK